MSVLDQIWPFLGQKSIFSEGGWSNTFDSLLSGKQWHTFFVLKTLTGAFPIGRWGRKCAILTRTFRAKSHFFVLESRFLSTGHITSTPGATTFPSSTKLGWTIWAIKKWPTMTTDLVPARNTEKRPFLRSAEKVFFGQKCVFPKKNSQNLLKDWFSFWKWVLFCSYNYSRSWPEEGVQPEVFFLAWNIVFLPLAQKSDFCHTTPKFDNGPFVALGDMVHFQPSEQFF